MRDARHETSPCAAIGYHPTTEQPNYPTTQLPNHPTTEPPNLDLEARTRNLGALVGDRSLGETKLFHVSGEIAEGDERDVTHTCDGIAAIDNGRG